MEKLEKYLTSKKISLSVAIYPHPAQILYDNNESKQIKIWKLFKKQMKKEFLRLDMHNQNSTQHVLIYVIIFLVSIHTTGPS